MTREKPKTRNERLQDYIYLAMKRKKVTFERLGNEMGLSKQTLHYRFEHNLLTFDEVSVIFAVLGTTDETKLKLMS